MAKPLINVKPLPVTDAILIATNVAETDHAAWAVGTTYAAGARVIVVATHKIYESLQAANVGKDPTLAANDAWWVEVGPTNRWKVLDTSNSSQTAQASSITYQFRPGQAVTSVALLNLTGATELRIRLIDPTYGTVYDETTDLSAVPLLATWYDWFFGARIDRTVSVATDIPSFPAADLYIDLTGSTALAVGVLMFGQAVEFGLGVQQGAQIGIQDYSRKEVNDYGDTVLVQRSYAKRASFDVLLTKAETDRVVTFLSSVRATPCLWIGSDQYEGTVVYGFYKDFNVTISYAAYSDCSLDIEGLT